MRYLSIIMLLLVACTSNLAQTKLLSVLEFEAKLASTPTKQVLDVRTADEYAQGHLAGAVLVDYYQSDFKSQLAKLDKTKPVFVYCAAGKRSEASAEILQQLGFKQVYDLEGGFRAWTGSKKPVVK
jgi:rhodanese-related sulfurtransferase